MINATGNRMTREIARQSQLASQIASRQTQVSTGKRIQRASDDPLATSRIAHIERAQANDTARSANIDFARSLTAQADSQLRATSDLLARARELTVAAANDALAAPDRAAIAAEIVSLASEIDGLSQARSANGEPLFAPDSSRIIRFDDQLSFAAVPSRTQAFGVAGMPISQTLRDTAIAIGAGNRPQIAASLTNISGAIDHVADANAQVGLNAARLERLRDNSELRSISNAEERSRLEDTDLATAIAELNGMTLTLEAAQAAFARINRRSLIDFLN